MKSEIRILGIDDSSFDKFNDRKVLVLGVMFRGGSFMDGVMATYADIDGDDATEQIALMVNTSKFKVQIKCIMLDGIAVGGFNVVDVVELNRMTGIPVIVIMRSLPKMAEVESALRMIGMERKIPLLRKAGEIVQMGKIHVQIVALNPEKAAELIRISCTRSYIPEPVRVAHLIGQGITMGESRGRA